MKIDLNAMTRRFVSGESLKEGRNPDITSYIQTLGEILQNMRPRSISERRRLEVAAQQLKEIRRHARRLQERVSVLEEQVGILEEKKGK